MGLRGVDRIMIAVKNLESAKRLYADMLGATFEDAHWTGEPFGIQVAIAWDAASSCAHPCPVANGIARYRNFWRHGAKAS